MTEEMWENMGNTSFLSLEKWPEYDESKTVENSIEIAVQINGRLRSTITIAKDSSKDDAIASAKADAICILELLFNNEANTTPTAIPSGIL